jgi:uncharacterized protein (DUF488 family)
VPAVWTIGHSTLPLERFLAILTRAEVRALADVRRFPGSRRHPQFNQPVLEEAARDAGIVYHSFPDLGGRRARRPDSLNTAWRVASFQGYADYMETPAFQAAAQRLIALAREARLAIMCAEALWWRCHRGLIADYLKAGGFDVIHLTESGQEVHPYTAAARLVAGRLSYRAEE